MSINLTDLDRIIAVADDHEVAVIDELRRRAGLVWDCTGGDPHGMVCWTNDAGDDTCEHCGRPRPKPEPGCDCEGRGWFNMATNGDDSRRWIEACTDCNQYETDDDAAEAAAKATGMTVAYAIPGGLDHEHPYLAEIADLATDEIVGVPI